MGVKTTSCFISCLYIIYSERERERAGGGGGSQFFFLH